MKKARRRRKQTMKEELKHGPNGKKPKKEKKIKVTRSRRHQGAPKPLFK